MVDTFIIPFSSLVEDVHFFGQMVGVDHIKVEAIMLFHKAFPLSAPIVCGCHRYNLLNWNIDLHHAKESESMKSEELGFWEHFHFKDELFICEISLNLEWNKRVEFSL